MGEDWQAEFVAICLSFPTLASRSYAFLHGIPIALRTINAFLPGIPIALGKTYAFFVYS